MNAVKEITGATSPIALKATGEDPSLRRTRMVITTGSGIPTTDLGVDSTVVLVIDRVTVDTTRDHLGIDMVAKAMMMDFVTGGVSGTTAMDPLVNDQGIEGLKMDLGIVRVSDQVMVETEDLMMVPGEMIVMETEEADLAVDGMLTIDKVTAVVMAEKDTTIVDMAIGTVGIVIVIVEAEIGSMNVGMEIVIVVTGIVEADLAETASRIVDTEIEIVMTTAETAPRIIDMEIGIVMTTAETASRIVDMEIGIVTTTVEEVTVMKTEAVIMMVKIGAAGAMMIAPTMREERMTEKQEEE